MLSSQEAGKKTIIYSFVVAYWMSLRLSSESCPACRFETLWLTKQKSLLWAEPYEYKELVSAAFS